MDVYLMGLYRCSTPCRCRCSKSPPTQSLLPERGNALKLYLKSRTRPYSLAVESEKNGHGDQSESYETQQAVAPSQSESVVHVQTCKWQEGAERGSEDSVGTDSGRGVNRKCIYKVCLNRHHPTQIPQPN